jgi:hypothetical protein
MALWRCEHGEPPPKCEACQRERDFREAIRLLRALHDDLEAGAVIGCYDLTPAVKKSMVESAALLRRYP